MIPGICPHRDSRASAGLEGQRAPAMIRRPLKAAAVGEYYQWSSRGRSARRSCPHKPRGNVPYGLSRFAGFFAPWSDAVPRYVMDLFGGNRLLVSQAFDGSDDAEAVAKAKVMFFGEAVSRPESPGIACATPFREAIGYSTVKISPITRKLTGRGGQ